MIISLKNRYIFIAVPKTGTTSVQKWLLENDPSARQYAVEIGGQGYAFREHATALEIKSILGEHYPKFRTFAFIRNPYSRLVSSYFFYKNGKPITAGNKKPWPSRFKTAYAKCVPFALWALSYPYKSNIEHLVDEENNLIVDYVGTFENLEDDLRKIISAIGLNIPVDQLPHTNKSSHAKYKDYFTKHFLRKRIERVIDRDLKFYNRYKFNL